MPDYTIPSDNRELQPVGEDNEKIKIIPYQVITGNYNQHSHGASCVLYYTIPSDNRELQPLESKTYTTENYTIPSDNRELQPQELGWEKPANYTIPSDNRELQHQKRH